MVMLCFSPPVLMRRFEIYGPRIVNISPKQHVSVGDSLQLDCLVDGSLGGVEGLELAWVKVAGVMEVEYLSVYSLTEGNMEYEEDLESELVQDNDGDHVWSLVIDNVYHDTAGLYQCQVLVHQQPISSREVLVSVRDHAPMDRFVVVKHGGNVTLDCLDCGDQRCDQTRGPPPRVNLIHVDRGDSGVYTCWVEDRRINVTVLVEHAPIIDLKRSSTSIYQSPGYPASFQCHVAGVPVPLITWQHVPSGEVIRSSSQHSVSINSYSDGVINSVLTFYNVTQSDFGQYRCLAENIQGKMNE